VRTPNTPRSSTMSMAICRSKSSGTQVNADNRSSRTRYAIRQKIRVRAEMRRNLTLPGNRTHRIISAGSGPGLIQVYHGAGVKQVMSHPPPSGGQTPRDSKSIAKTLSVCFRGLLLPILSTSSVEEQGCIHPWIGLHRGVPGVHIKRMFRV
jgi:hypothetical protein